jgi:hypothetical protein
LALELEPGSDKIDSKGQIGPLAATIKMTRMCGTISKPELQTLFGDGRNMIWMMLD